MSDVIRQLARETAVKIAAECSGAGTDEGGETIAVFETADGSDLILAALRQAQQVQRDEMKDGIRFDEETGTYIARFTILTAGRTEPEAHLALASAVKLLAEAWPKLATLRSQEIPK